VHSECNTSVCRANENENENVDSQQSDIGEAADGQRSAASRTSLHGEHSPAAHSASDILNITFNVKHVIFVLKVALCRKFCLRKESFML